MGLDPLNSFTSLKDSEIVRPVMPLLRDAARRPNKIWIDWGLVRGPGFENSWIEARATERSREMVSILEQQGYRRGADLFVREDPQGGHNEDSWARRFPDVIRALYPRR